MTGEILLGRLVTGIGHGKRFTRLDWARRQFVDKLGIDPFPGTINMIVEAADSVRVWNRLKGTPGVRIENPNDGPHDCDARCYPVSIDGRIEAAIVVPEVPNYSPVQIEVIAAVGVREALAVDDGDSLKLEIRQPRQQLPNSQAAVACGSYGRKET
jgi:CTP-dependent riboflavin kinase